jgi:hypothetical protein
MRKILLLATLCLTACSGSLDSISVVQKWENNIREGRYDKARSGYCETSEFDLLYDGSPYLLNENSDNLEFVLESQEADHDIVVIKDLSASNENPIALQVWETRVFFQIPQAELLIKQLNEMPKSPMNDRTKDRAEQNLKEVKKYISSLDKYCVKKTP